MTRALDLEARWLLVCFYDSESFLHRDAMTLEKDTEYVDHNPPIAA